MLPQANTHKNKLYPSLREYTAEEKNEVHFKYRDLCSRLSKILRKGTFPRSELREDDLVSKTRLIIPNNLKANVLFDHCQHVKESLSNLRTTRDTVPVNQKKSVVIRRKLYDTKRPIIRKRNRMSEERLVQLYSGHKVLSHTYAKQFSQELFLDLID